MPSPAKPAMLFFTFVWKNIFRRRARSALTVVGLAVAVAAVVALVGISDGFSRHFQELYDRRGVDLVVQRVGSGAELNNGLPENLGDKIAGIPGVDAVMGGLMDVVSFPDKDLTNVIINGWRADSPLFDELHILPGGRRLVKGDHKKVILGSVLAGDLGVKVGDKIPIYGENVEIVGIYSSSQVYERSSIATLLSDMQRYMNRPHQVTGFIVRSNIPKDGTPEHREALSALGKQIEALDEGIVAVPSTEFIENVSAIKLARVMAWATSAIALLIGAIGMLNTMVMSVYERIREIGTLRAIGWRKIQVVRMILVEALLLSLAGGVVGSVAAVGLTHLLSNMRVARYISGDVAPWVFVEGFLLAVAVGLIGAVYPAIWGANLRPIEALRRK